MALPISITYSTEPELPFEVVERKGIGHPDSLADAIAEEASRCYSQYMKKNFGGYAHHWFDKVMLLGGEASIEYGKGEIIAPFTVIFAGKVVRNVGLIPIPIDSILTTAATNVLQSVLNGFVPEKHLVVKNQLWDARGPGQHSSRYRPQTNEDLVSSQFSMISNDCNVCCGFAPLSALEEMVLETEKFFTTKPRRFQDTGTDVKIVGTRRSGRYHLLVNLPFLAHAIKDWEHYLKRVEECKEALHLFLKQKFNVSIEIVVNPEKAHLRPYLTATGTVADTGDIGAVGRGNRINGLITPYRAMSIEASNGKNPLDHTGKIYGVLASRIAEHLYQAFNVPVEVCLITSKGRPVDKPDDVFVKFYSKEPLDNTAINAVIEEDMNSISDLIEEFIDPGIVQF